MNYKNYRSAKIEWAFYGGPVIGESAIKHLNEIGPKVSHIYEVFNEGPWRVSTLEVRISWPYEVANDKAHGKWLLYLEELPTVQSKDYVIRYITLFKIEIIHAHRADCNLLALGEGECILPSGHVVNPLKLQDSISYDDIDVFQSAASTPPTLYNHTNHVRTTRDTEKVVNTRTIIDKDGHRRQVVSMVSSNSNVTI